MSFFRQLFSKNPPPQQRPAQPQPQQQQISQLHHRRQVEEKDENVIAFNRHLAIYLQTKSQLEFAQAIEHFNKISQEKYDTLLMLSSFCSAVSELMLSSIRVINEETIEWLIGKIQRNTIDGNELFQLINNLSQKCKQDIVNSLLTRDLLNQFGFLYFFQSDSFL